MSATMQFRGQADDTAERNAHDVNEAANAAGAAVRDASRKLTEAVTEFGERASNATQELTRRVEQQPLSSVAIAVGAGIVLGLILGRR